MNAVRPTEPASSRAHDGDLAFGLVPAVSTAYRILDALADLRPSGATLSELARALHVSKGTMHAQLATLGAHRLVERDPVTRRFRLGPRLVELGAAARLPDTLAAIAVERLPTLAGEYHMTFALAGVERPDHAVLTHRAYPLDETHVGLAIGNRYGVGDGAIGKCLLSAMPASAARRAANAHPLSRHTSRTILDPDQLLAQAAQVRECGWAGSAGELKENHAIAVSLRGADGRLELILCAVCFPSELPEAEFAAFGHALWEVGQAMEAAAASGSVAPTSTPPSTGPMGRRQCDANARRAN